MRPFVPTPIGWFIALAVTCLALRADAQQSPPPRKSTGIDFTEPAAPAAGPSTNQTEKTKSLELPSLNAPIRKPFEIFGGAADSFSGIGAPPPRRRVQPSAAEAKRLKEAMDRKKNWAFQTPEEMFGIAESEDDIEAAALGALGDTPKTSWERYLDREGNRRATAGSNQMNKDVVEDIFGLEAGDETEVDSEEEKSVLTLLSQPAGQLPESLAVPGVTTLGEITSSFESLMGSSERSGSVLDLTQPTKLESSVARSAIHEENMKEFKAAIESRTLASPTPLTTLAPPVRSELAAPAAFSVGNVLGGANPAGSLAPVAPPTAFGAVVPSLPSLSPVQNYSPPPPAAAPVSRFTPVTSFEPPRRKF